MITVMASHSYDSEPQIVPVNSEDPITISSTIADVQLCVRIRGFNGSPKHDPPLKDSPYFQYCEDLNISIQFSFTPKEDINGEDLLFGNDFDTSIGDFLPYGAGTALKLFKRFVDPSVEGDLYCPKPYLYGKALSSLNVINDNAGEIDKDDCSKPIEEVIDLSNIVTDGSVLQPSDRQVFFQKKENLEKFTFEKGRTYQCDFFSGFLSLEDSNIKIAFPGFQLDLTPYLNDKFNRIRYVLKVAGSSCEGVDCGTPLLVLTSILEVDDRETDTDGDDR